MARKKDPSTHKKRGAKLKFIVTPEILEEVRLLAGRGLTQQQIHHYYGIGRTLWYEVCDLHPELRTAVLQGRAKAHSYVFGKLMEKVRAGNLNAIIFYLKTQAGCSELRPRSEDDGETADDKPIIPMLTLSITDPVEAAKIYQRIMAET